MSFESSIFNYALMVFPEEAMEYFDYERDFGAGLVEAVTPECREAWIITQCMFDYYRREYPDWNSRSLAAPADRPQVERDLFENLARWHMSILALNKAQSRQDDKDSIFTGLAEREIAHCHDYFNQLADSTPR